MGRVTGVLPENPMPFGTRCLACHPPGFPGARDSGRFPVMQKKKRQNLSQVLSL